MPIFFPFEKSTYSLHFLILYKSLVHGCFTSIDPGEFQVIVLTFFVFLTQFLVF